MRLRLMARARWLTPPSPAGSPSSSTAASPRRCALSLPSPLLLLPAADTLSPSHPQTFAPILGSQDKPNRLYYHLKKDLFPRVYWSSFLNVRPSLSLSLSSCARARVRVR